jgi:hypothetical protein
MSIFDFIGEANSEIVSAPMQVSMGDIEAKEAEPRPIDFVLVEESIVIVEDFFEDTMEIRRDRRTREHRLMPWFGPSTKETARFRADVR